MLGSAPLGNSPLGATLDTGGVIATGAIGTITATAPAGAGGAVLGLGSNPQSYTGADVIYLITQTGTLTVKLWGGAGGSNTNAGGVRMGGTGGWTNYAFSVHAGDRVKVQVGGGGKDNTVMTGGWPDGGQGAQSSVSAQYNGGGGGGSTRIWLDVGGVGSYTLMAVAGAGGGIQDSFASSPTYAGNGGGTTGVAASLSVGATNRAGGPGTQSAGGAQGTGNGSTPAGSLLGGSGGGALSSVPGGGGGGGFFGGGGGAGNGSSNTGPGGGGSGYINTAHANYLALSGSLASSAAGATTPPGTGDADYPTSPANVGSTVLHGAGGNGYAAVAFSTGVAASTSGAIGTINLTAPAGSAAQLVPASTSGAIGTINLTAPAGSVTAFGWAGTVAMPSAITVSAPAGVGGVIGLAAGDIGTITDSAPDATAAGAVSATGAIGTVTMVASTSPVLQAQAIIFIPLVDYSITTDPGAATVTGGVSMSDVIGTITTVAVTGLVPGAAGSQPFANDITVTPPAASVSVAFNVALPSLNLSAPAATLSAGMTASFALPSAITLSNPSGFASLDSVGTGGDIGTINLSIGDGVVSSGIEFPIDLPAAVTLVAATATGHGAGAADTTTTQDNSDHLNPFIAKFTAIAPAGSATGAVALAVSPTLEIDVVAMTGTAHLSSFILITIPGPVLLSISGAVAHISADVSAALPTIVTQYPEGAAHNGTGAFGLVPVINIVPISGAAGIPGGATVALPVIVLTPPTTGTPADTTVDLPSLKLKVPTAMAEGDTSSAPYRLKRSDVFGRAPVSLVEREVVLNEADGILFYRAPTGDVARTPYKLLSQDDFAPDGGSEGQVLAGDGTWKEISVEYSAPVRNSMPETADGEVIALMEGAYGFLEDTPDQNLVLYRPFFVAKAIKISHFGVQVVFAGDNTAFVGICTWDVTTQAPADLLASGEVSLSVTGSALVQKEVILTPGWYASMVVFIGGGDASLLAGYGPVDFDDSFEPVGDPSAPFGDGLSPPPVPTANRAVSRGYMIAQASPA